MQLYGNKMDIQEEMDKFLEKHSILRQNQEESEKVNRLIRRNTIETENKNLPKNKVQNQMNFTGKFYPIFIEIPILLKLFYKTTEGGMLPNLISKVTMTLLPNLAEISHTKKKITDQYHFWAQEQ